MVRLTTLRNEIQRNAFRPMLIDESEYEEGKERQKKRKKINNLIGRYWGLIWKRLASAAADHTGDIYTVS